MKKLLLLWLALIAVFQPLHAQLPLEDADNAAAVREALEVVPARTFFHGNNAGVHAFRQRIERGESVALAGISDSTFRDNAGPLYQLATLLGTQYSTHRVELFRAASNLQSIAKTVIDAGPSGELYREFPDGAVNGSFMGAALQRSSLDGVTGFRVEIGISLPASRLNGSGWPTSTADVTGFGSAGNRSIFYLNSSGILTVQAQGAAADSANIAASAAIPAMVANTRVDFRVDFTATNGSNSLATFYRSTDGGANWTAVGTTDRTGTAIVLTHPAGASYYLASRSGAPSISDLRVFRCQWYSTTTTPVPVLPERIDAWTAPEGQTGLTSVLGGSPTIYIDQCAQDGATLKPNGFFTGAGAGDLSVEAYRGLLDHLPDIAIFNSSHNDGGVLAPDWETYMDSAVTVANNWFLRDPVIIHTTQNPEKSSTPNELVEQHRRRQGDIIVYAAKKGRGCFDPYTAWKVENDATFDIDNDVHATSPGYAFWGRVYLAAILDGTNEANP